MQEKKITVNGKFPEMGQKVTDKDRITVNGKVIEPSPAQHKKLFAFNKPKGVECTMQTSDQWHTLANYDFGPDRVYPIGRLDKESHGLVLMTNDGDLANRLTHPRYEHEKEYIVTVDQDVTLKMLKQLSDGSIIVHDKKVQKAHVEKIGPKKFRIILKEGRNRQIRKMCGAINLTVLDLLRVRIVGISLPKIAEGSFEEIDINSVL